MYVRSIALLLTVVGAAAIALNFLVQDHIKNVAITHAGNKARHMVEILEEQHGGAILLTYREGEEAHSNASGGLEHHDSDILRTTFFDISGQVIPEHQEDHDDHGVDAHGERHEFETHELLLDSPEVSDHGRHGHGHETPKASATPGPNDQGSGAIVLMSEYYQGLDATGQDLQYVTVLLSLEDAAGDRVGYAEYEVDISEISTVYSSGLVSFAVLLVVLGAAVFGIPALGYISQKKLTDRSTSKANYLVNFDALTDLLNRRGFLRRAMRALEKGSLSHLAFLDVDQFKNINDTYGHATGDAYLCHVSNLIKHHFDDTAFLSRQGGDEFIIAVVDEAKIDVVQTMEKLRQDCAQEVLLNGLTINSSLSIGIVQVTAGYTLDDVMSDADVALYFAKAEGRNCVAVFDSSMGHRLQRRRLLEVRLREAMEREEFILHYQPLIDAKSHKLIGYEALLRLHDSNGVPVSPDEFIPIAEEMGLIDQMGSWVLFEATQRISEISDSLWVSVNLSSEQFNSGNLPETVKSALDQAGLPASRLELEITESLLLDGSTMVTFQIDTLKEMGISIAMDDFGTGFSSLSYLWKFGFDRIKLDRSFLLAFEDNPAKSRGLIETIVMLGEKLHMAVTAEGIETKKQSDLLASLGCDVLQGFYFGQPEPLGCPAQNGKTSTQRGS